MSQKEPAFRNMLGQAGSHPKEFFDEVIKKEKETLEKYKDEFKHLIKGNGIRFPLTIEFEAFDLALQKYDFYAGLELNTRRMLHEYYIYKVQSKEQEKKHKQEKIHRKLEDFLFREISLNDTKFENYKDRIAERSSDFRNIPEETQRKIFDKMLEEVEEDERERSRKR